MIAPGTSALPTHRVRPRSRRSTCKPPRRAALALIACALGSLGGSSKPPLEHTAPPSLPPAVTLAVDPGALGEGRPLRARSTTAWSRIDFPDQAQVELAPGVTLRCDARDGRLTVEIVAPDGLSALPHSGECTMVFGNVQVLFTTKPPPRRLDDGSWRFTFDGPGCDTVTLEQAVEPQRRKGDLKGVTCEVDETGRTLKVCALPKRWASASSSCALRTAGGTRPIEVHLVDQPRWAEVEPPTPPLTLERLERAR